jgi:hypothetical protein
VISSRHANLRQCLYASIGIIMRDMRTVCFVAFFVAFSRTSYCLDLTVKIKSGRVRGTGVEMISFKGIPNGQNIQMR